MNDFQSKVSLIWNIAELLRGSWKAYEYQDVILPLTVLRRLDCIIEPHKQDMLNFYNNFSGKIDVDLPLKKNFGLGFYNVSAYDFNKLLDDQKNISKNLKNYIEGFSHNVKDIMDKFDFTKHIKRLEGGNLLYLIIKEFNKVDLHPDMVSNHEMGYIFEELIRKFSEQSNETAGEHYTPREVIHLMARLLLSPDEKKLKQKGQIRTIYDPACGTGGMLTLSKEFALNQINKNLDIRLYGQEINPVTYAICKADILIKGENPDLIKGGEEDHSLASTLSNDQFFNSKFDYILSNPPYGVDWKKDKDAIEKEAQRGFSGRFGAGTPRISDGQLLFLQHMISKMRDPKEGSSRIAVVFNGSPLFTGDAGSGESEIRRWMLENDWLETIIALPDQLFYNTGIYTYIWVLSNEKEARRKNKVQLIDARKFFIKMRKSLGSKRNEISTDFEQTIIDEYNTFAESEHCKIFETTDFGYRQITIERPLRLSITITDDKLNNFEIKAKNRDEIVDTLTNFKNTKYQNPNKFFDALNSQLCSKLTAPIKKNIIAHFGQRDNEADILLDENGQIQADSELRDTENVPYGQDIYEYFKREVKPYVPDAWIDETKVDIQDEQVGKVGYEIPLTRYFYKYEPPRKLEDIEADIASVEKDLQNMLKELEILT
jgi:type I restriction enzyme M protein